ncbi:hypothetical protein MMC30_003294 [Trapelia coarctata]|nr:hypothetical protein [Trapelia coarctata]
MSLSPYSSPAAPIPASLSSLISTAAATAAPSPSDVNAAVSVPLSTGSPSQPSMTAAGDSFSTSTFVDTATVTYTMGSGSSTTVLTTVVHLTSTQTIFSTLYRTSDAASSNNAAGAASSTNVAGAASSTNAAGDAEATTTISSTSTRTLFVTVQKPAATDAAIPTTTPALNVAAAQSTGAGTCPEPVTVTVSAEYTVTVTASPPPSSPSTVDAAVSQSAAPTFTEGPYGMGNATATGYASSGFVTLPSGSPTGTGSPISGYRRRR